VQPFETRVLDVAPPNVMVDARVGINDYEGGTYDGSQQRERLDQ
jgi:hypothetical protein